MASLRLPPTPHPQAQAPPTTTKKLYSGHCAPMNFSPSPLSIPTLIWLVLFTTSIASALPLPRPYDVLPGGIYNRPRPASAIGSTDSTPGTISSVDSISGGGPSWWERLSHAAVMRPAEQLWGDGGRELEAAEELGVVVEGDDGEEESSGGVVSEKEEEGERKLLGWERWALPWMLGGVGGAVRSGSGGGGGMLVHVDPVVQKEAEKEAEKEKEAEEEAEKEKEEEKEEEKQGMLKGEIKKGDKVHGHITGVNRPEAQQLEVLKGEFAAGEKAHGHTHTTTGVNRPEPQILTEPITGPEGEVETPPSHSHAHPTQFGDLNHPFPQHPPNLDPVTPLLPSSQHGHSHPPNPENRATQAPPSVLHDDGAKKAYQITPTAGHDLQRRPETNIGDAWKPLINQDELWTYPPSPLSAGMDPERWPKSRLEPVSALDKGNPLPGLRMWGEMQEEEERRRERENEKNRAPLMLTFGEGGRTPVEGGRGSGYEAKIESAATTPELSSPNRGGSTSPLSSSTDFLFRPPTPGSSSSASPPRTPIPWPDITPDHPTPPIVDPTQQRTWPNSPGLADADSENFPLSVLDPLSIVDAEDPLPSLRKWWEQRETEREWQEVNQETGREGGGSSSHRSGQNTPHSPQADPVFEEHAEGGSWGSRSSWGSTDNSNNNNNGARGGEGMRFKMSTPGSESSSPMYPHPKSPGWQIFGGLTPGLKKDQQKEIIMMQKLGVPAKDKWGFVKWNLDSTDHGVRLKSGVLEWGGELLESLFGGGRGRR